ncbi:MAG: RNA polymerase sigma-70 factor [Proteiniphilum sp.]|nr:RNA polymerase sigma-70 factor [Proteiniphilum sp.]MDD3908469.1 RNA polymerase sigma-70 factor [Proteiniphilum sp.]MDD4415958.1 RNA polymerase sigma-70 factor [Proteiniphilum sp.]
MGKNLETDIIEGLKLGNEKAFEYIYKIYYSDLCRIAKGYLTDSYLSESIVGDLIYSLWENRSKIEIHTSLKSYLFKSVTNKCINYLQLEYVRKETTCSLEDLEVFGNLWSMGSSPLQELEQEELASIIRNTIDTMSPETKQVFMLSRIENKKQKEIAEIMGITVHTVKYHMGNALKKIKESINLYITLIIFMINMFN